MIQKQAFFKLCLLLATFTLITVSILNYNRLAFSQPTLKTSRNIPKPWYKSKARPCSEWVQQGQLLPHFRSQSSEDEILLSFFSTNLCKGSFIELGALDGEKFSNSYVFSKALDWKGVMIEASPKNYPQLEINRPNEIALVNKGVCNQEQDLHWVDGGASATHGFVEFASEAYKKRWWTKEMIQDAKMVPCFPLTSILKEAVGTNFWFDFFSLDVEGAEFSVLESLDFDKFAFGVIFVEANPKEQEKNKKVIQLLKSKGYKYLYRRKRSDWFQHESFASAYSEFSSTSTNLIVSPKNANRKEGYLNEPSAKKAKNARQVPKKALSKPNSKSTSTGEGAKKGKKKQLKKKQPKGK